MIALFDIYLHESQVNIFIVNTGAFKYLIFKLHANLISLWLINVETCGADNFISFRWDIILTR